MLYICTTINFKLRNMKNKNQNASKLPVVKTKQKEISHKVNAHRIPLTSPTGEFIPNAHRQDEFLGKELDLSPVIDEKDLVVMPIFSPIEVEERVETLPYLNPVPEEVKVQYNLKEETYTPVQRIEAFVIANFKEHLIERTLFISLIEVISEAKKQESEL